MRELTSTNFGLLIAYLLPGVTALWGVSYFSPVVRTWLGTVPAAGPTVGGFLYVTLASVAAGLVASTVRWMIVDTVHHWTGIPRPRWDFSRFEQKVAAFSLLGEVHYRYYQWYGNTLVALTFTYVARRLTLGFFATPISWIDAAFLALAILLAAGSRDTYLKYNERVSMVLRQRRIACSRSLSDATANADQNKTGTVSKKGQDEPITHTPEDWSRA